MGYSHQWYRPQVLDAETFRLAVGDVRRVLKAVAARGVRLAGPDGNGSPIASADTVSFNGFAAESYEVFAVERIFVGRRKEDGTCFNFCKTAHRAYDIAVCAVLLVFKRHFGDAFRVMSDGRLDQPDDWAPAVGLVRDVLGYDGEWEYDKEKGVHPKVGRMRPDSAADQSDTSGPLVS